MSLERCCYLFIFSMLPILWLPESGLFWGLIGAVLAFPFIFYKRWLLLCFIILLIGISYARVIHFSNSLHHQTTQKARERIKIQRILTQSENPTAIAKRYSGDLVYIRWQTKQSLQQGNTYLAELNLRPISARLNEGNFNRQRWYLAQSISATATVKQAEQLVEQPDIRSRWLERVQKQIHHLPSKGLILALTFGERAWLSHTEWESFRQTATAHLIAISGLHIALASGIGFMLGKGMSWLLGYLCFNFRLKQAVKNPHFFALFLGLITAWIYTFLAGFSLPTVRAAIAITLITVCLFSRYYYTPYQFWLRCVCVLIVFDPLSLLSDSFWLSVLAVASLIFWYRYFPLAKLKWLETWQKKHRVLAFLIKLLHLQLGIALCFLPIQLYFFDGVATFAFLANLLIVPLYSVVIVPLILLSLVSDNLFQSWGLVDYLFSQSLVFLEWLSNWQTLSRSIQWKLICADLLILGIIYWYKALRSYLSTLVVGVLICYQLGELLRDAYKQPDITWLHFDIGQGLAMAFVYFDEKGDKKAVLYDTGAAWQGGSMAETEIIPYLKRQGIELSHLILSHDDNDHAGGLLPLLTNYPSTIVIRSSRQFPYPQTESCFRGKTWQFGKLKLTAVYPDVLVEKAKNEHSCVLVGEIGKFKLLLTGDSGIAEERQFAHRVGQIDFLQVGHHGSQTSTSYTLLAVTQPRYAFISTGRFNLWKMPNKSVVERLEKLGIRHFNTAKTGMIKVQFYQDNFQIQTTRNANTAWYSSYFGQ